MRRLAAICTLATFFLTPSAQAEKPSSHPAHGSEEGIRFFIEQVEPIFVETCYRCHGNGQNRGDLSFYTREGLLQGGESGASFDEDSPADGMLLSAINYDSFEMPPSGKLPQERIDIITRWLEMGAPYPERTDVLHLHEGPPEVNEETKSHWTYVAPQKPDVPGVDSDWVKTPVDAFILNQLTKNGLQPNPPAEKLTLIRRVTYDLTGLPPTQAEIDAFLKDDRPDAYERLVESLMASPHYGEQWARYWLDLMRYAESNSFERDDPKPFVWKYRDYVINSFNNDKPYDQFLIEQLAGDEIPNATPESMIATGFYRLGTWDDEPADPALARYDEFDDIISTVGQGFLGMTLNCARCHDHKLDPIPAADYYGFLAFFNNVQRYGLRSSESVAERSIRDISTPEQKQRYELQNKEYREKLDALRAELDRVEAIVLPKLVGGEIDDFKADSVRERIIQKHAGTLLPQNEVDAYVRTRGEWNELRNHPPASAEQALVVTEPGPDVPPTYILSRGNPGAEGDIVEPRFPSILSPPAVEVVVPENGKSSGRRLALAKWIADKNNPMTARVMANRLWQWHFDAGIVESSNNFGLTTERPIHGDLLDWLATEFQENGWSIKNLHRQILLSNTYQMSSAPNAKALAQDPQNLLLWRVAMRRLRAEEIRDSILAMNNTLQANKLFGPSVYPKMPEAILAGQSMPGHNWPTSNLDDSARRSIYIHVKRSMQVPLLAAFDVADSDFTCPSRFATTQPTQALGMLNSEFMNEQAEILAQLVKSEAGDNIQDQVKLALLRTTQRVANDREIEECVKLIDSLQKDYGLTKEAAMKSFCLVAYNLNEAIYLD